ncbi:MAG: 50S ribosomal protein L25 [Spirochaetes bacterium]|nr:50S ribosomal protein L25 [Spirochaetota bacterium]
METVAFSAVERKELKKSATRRLRKEGMIPGIVYGYVGTIPIAVNAHDFRSKFHRISENTIINLKVGDKIYDVLIKDYQTNILKGTIEHLDFYALRSDKPVRTRIPLHLVGSSKGVREGGILEVQLHELEVECLPKDLQDQIQVDITHLESGHALHVKDLKVPAGIKVLSLPDQVVVSVVHARAEVAAKPAAEGAAPTPEGVVTPTQEGTKQTTASSKPSTEKK